MADLPPIQTLDIEIEAPMLAPPPSPVGSPRVSTTELQFVEQLARQKEARSARNRRWREAHKESIKQKRLAKKAALLADPEKLQQAKEKERVVREKRKTDPVIRARIAAVRKAWRVRQKQRKQAAAAADPAAAPAEQNHSAAPVSVDAGDAGTKQE